MSEPFLSEIKIMSFPFAPRGWAYCNGQLLPINQNQALFSLLGTTYGGDGRVNFALPDLRDRIPIHTGNGHTLGERAGEAAHTLTTSEMPAHAHEMLASGQSASQAFPAGALLAPPSSALGTPFLPQAPTATLASGTVGTQGNNQPHNNLQPCLAVNFCIALQGIFPSQN
jgi:microcystin-dependent protein